MVRRNSKSSSWYCVPLVWLAVSLPLSAVLAGLLTYYFALQEQVDAEPASVHRVAQMQVTDLAADEAAMRKNLSAIANIDPVSRAIVIDLSGIEVSEALNLQLTHSMHAALDHRLPLHKTADGLWRGIFPSGLPGSYQLELMPADASWRLTGLLRDNEKQIRLISKLTEIND